MEQKEFLRILKKYRLGKASPEEKKLIDTWYEAMGEQSHVMPDIREKELEKDYWASITERMPHMPQSASAGKSRFISYSIGIAASVLIATISFIYVNERKKPGAEGLTELEKPLPPAWEEIVNAKNSARRFTLSDGSSVTLKPQSLIRFSSHFKASVREVHLEGEAFFEVARNEQRPFLVYANNVTTKVLGTSFTVKAFKHDRSITVSVKTGKVSVCTNPSNKPDEKAEVILTPNQQIIYDKSEEKITRRIVETPQPLLEPEEIKRMRFEEAPVKEIFEAIENIYGIEIVFDEDIYSSCSLTTSISDGDLYKRLDIVTSAIGAGYALREDKIVINGKGCD